MWQFALDEINTHDISSKDAYDTKLRDSMQDHIAYDFLNLERAIGEKVTEDDLMYVAKHNPNIFGIMVKKVFSFLIYVARMPIDWNDGQGAIVRVNQVIDNIIADDMKRNNGQAT